MKYFLSIIIGVLVTLFGLYLWFNQEATIHFIATYAGILFILFTILGFIVMRTLKVEQPPYGQLVLTGVIGLVFLFLPLVSYSLLTWIFILIFFLFALLNIVHIIQRKEKVNVIKYVFQILFAIIFIIYAITMLLNPSLGGQTLTKIIAFFIIINGVAYFFPTNYLLNMKE